MSDEFIKVATKEITEEIASIKKILELCKDDAEISEHLDSIEKHLHKIKGLAPMMGKEQIGEIAVLNENLLKLLYESKNIEGIYTTLWESNVFMEKSMTNPALTSESLKQKIATKYSKFLD